MNNRAYSFAKDTTRSESRQICRQRLPPRSWNNLRIGKRNLVVWMSSFDCVGNYATGSSKGQVESYGDIWLILSTDCEKMGAWGIDPTCNRLFCTAPHMCNVFERRITPRCRETSSTNEHKFPAMRSLAPPPHPTKLTLVCTSSWYSARMAGTLRSSSWHQSNADGMCQGLEDSPGK